MVEVCQVVHRVGKFSLWTMWGSILAVRHMNEIRTLSLSMPFEDTIEASMEVYLLVEDSI